MRVRTLIAAADAAYTTHISGYISEHHADTIEISVCNTPEQMHAALKDSQFDVVLADEPLINEVDTKAVALPMLLWAGKAAPGVPATVRRVRKHRRISRTVSDILQRYAAVSGNVYIGDEPDGYITAVWSPCGGTGKTTVALAGAACAVMKEKEVFYLNLETFATTPVVFAGQGKSISTVFEMLENSDGNARMLVQGISGCEDGIKYLCAPDNFDDVCILSPANVRELVLCCASITGELFVDLPCVCDARTRQVFELADRVLLVIDDSETASAKLAQFTSQSDVFESIKEKTLLVINKTSDPSGMDTGADELRDFLQPAISLPLIQSADVRYIYKTLAGSMQIRNKL